MKFFSTCFLIIFLSLPLFAQENMLSGQVLSLIDSSAITGVNVLIKGTSVGTLTDRNGDFSISLTTEKNILVFSSIGFRSEEIQADRKSFLTIYLKEEVAELSEIIVVGYGTQAKKNLTSAISKIETKEMQTIPASSIDQLIQGRAPGVYASSYSGEPGTGILVRIRGFTSVSSTSEPLYVIDGVPVITGDNSKIRAGSPTNALAEINPNDVQSIEILKDASATAIYGARAANGVVLITTRKGGQNTPASIEFSINYGVSKAWKDPDKIRVSGPEFEKLQNEAAANNWIDSYGSLNAEGPNGTVFKQPFANPDNTTDTNWMKQIFRSGSVRNTNLSLTGGAEKIAYYLSVGEFQNEGIIKPSKFSRKSARLNLDLLASSKLKVGINLAFSVSDRNRVNNGNDVTGAITNALFYPSNIPIYNNELKYNRPLFENPVAVVEQTDYAMKTTKVIGNIYGIYKIAKNLSFTTTWGLDNTFVDEFRYFNTKLGAGAAVNGLAASFISRYDSWINENLLNYNLNYNNHSGEILIGNTNQESQTNLNHTIGMQFPSDAFKQLSSAAVISNAGSSETSYGLVSCFARINYSFKYKYLISLSVRADASSRFGAKNRWGTFPAVSFGWRVSEESFMREIRQISNLKLRGSYGITGNQNGISDFQSLNLWGGQPGGLRGGGGTTPINTIGASAGYANQPGFVPNQLGNETLRWEKTSQLDFGFDLGLFDNLLFVTFDYYNKQTSDLLLPVAVPLSLGYNQIVRNYGSMENKGWELGIQTTLLTDKNFSWNLGLNLSHNKNKVKKIVSPINAFSREFIRVEEGYPLFSFWVHEQLGVDPETGNIIWNKGDDDKFDSNTDRFIVGNAQPDLFGGLSNHLRFKNFDLSIFCQFNYGNEILNYNRYFFEHGGERNTGYISTQKDRWQKPGDKTDVPRMTKVNYSAELRPSRFVEDGSYLRLKNVELGYSIATSFLNKIGLNKARIYIASQNLYTITNYSGLDPEVSVDPSEIVAGIDFALMPQPRTLLGGITLTF